MSWEEVVQIFKDQLGIDKRKNDSSVRDINGLFLVQVNLTKDQITDSFYSGVRSSKVLALMHSPLCVNERYEILEAVYEVETKLRNLLIHISDVAEGYYDYFLKSSYTKDFAKKKSPISSGDLNPVTSHLTFGDMLNILSINLSWNNRTLTAQDLLQLLNEQSEINSVRSILRSKIKNNLVWDEVCKYVLKRQVAWAKIKEDLHRLKDLRDKAAHFQIVTKKDATKAKQLTKNIMSELEQKDVSVRDLKKLREATYPQFTKFLDSAQHASDVFAEFQKRVSDPFEGLASQLAAQVAMVAQPVDRGSILKEALKRRLDELDQNPNNDQGKSGRDKQ